MRSSLIWHFDTCTGCRICELTCSIVKFGTFRPNSALMRITSGERLIALSATTCKQCENPFCARVCPVGAILRDQETGIVHVDSEKCNGCKRCVEYCPENAIWIDSISRKAIKCDMCGGSPECVSWCPTGAIEVK